MSSYNVCELLKNMNEKLNTVCVKFDNRCYTSTMRPWILQSLKDTIERKHLDDSLIMVVFQKLWEIHDYHGSSDF